MGEENVLSILKKGVTVCKVKIACLLFCPRQGTPENAKSTFTLTLHFTSALNTRHYVSPSSIKANQDSKIVDSVVSWYEDSFCCSTSSVECS